MKCNPATSMIWLVSINPLSGRAAYAATETTNQKTARNLIELKNLKQ
jgi:hypothetical protein